MSLSKSGSFSCSPDPKTSFMEFRMQCAKKKSTISFGHSKEESFISVDLTVQNPKATTLHKVPEQKVDEVAEDFSSEEELRVSGINEELKKIQECCEDFLQILLNEREGKQANGVKKIKKLINEALCDTRNIINKRKCLEEYDESDRKMVEKILGIVSNVQNNVKTYVLAFGLSIEDTLEQLIADSSTQSECVQFLRTVIDRLKRYQSELKVDLLETAKKKRSNEEVKHLQRSSLPKLEGKNYLEPSYADLLQHKGFGERCFLADIRDDLREVQKRFKDLYLRKKNEAGSAGIDVCIQQIRKALKDAGERVKDTIESAITEIGSGVGDGKGGTETYKLILTSIILLDDTKANIESCMYLLARNVAKVLDNDFPSNENQGFMKSFRELITKLNMSNSEEQELAQ